MHPEKGKQRSLRGTVNTILNHLAREGYAQQGKFTKESHSEISLTDEQRIVLNDLIEILDNFSSRDGAFLAEGRRLAREIAADTTRSSRLIEKARRTSSRVNMPGNYAPSLIFQLLREHQGKVTNREIQAYMASQGRI